MKYVFLGDNYAPARKFGAEVAAMTGLGLVGSVAQAQSAQNIADNQIFAQRQENQLNRDWQTQEAEKARGYNTSERVASQDFAKQMLDYQNEYNSIRNQVQRLQEGNINPQVALSGNVQNVSASSSLSSPASSPIPSMVSGLSPVPQQPLDLQIPALLNGAGSLVKNLAEAKGKSVETDRMIKTMQDYIDQAHFDTQIKELNRDTISIDKYIKEQVRDSAITKAWDEAKKANYDALASANEVSLYDIQKRLLESQEQLNRALSAYHGENAELVRRDILSYNRRTNAIVNLQVAQTKEALQNAFTSKAVQAITEAKTAREKIQKVMDIINNGIKANEFTAGQLGLTSAQLKQLQDKKYLDNLLSGYGVPLWFDNFFHRLKDYIPSIPVGFIKGVK